MIQRLRVPLGFVAAGVVLYFASPTTESLVIGIPIAALGLIFRVLAAGVIKKDSRLAISGAYAWTRNPLYFGTFLLVAGFAVMSANIGLAVLLVGSAAFVYSHVIGKEEAHLNKLFPDQFRSYRSKVPAFFPRIRRGEWDFSFRQYAANREYNAALGFAAMLGLFLLKWFR